ncbi:DUF4411 family protein [Corynebacterium riegelii]
MCSYTLDSNILIGLARHYPREYFNTLWVRIEELVVDGRACICAMVLEEVSRGTDDLYAWAKSMDGFVHEPNAEEYKTLAQISSDHPGWVQEDKNAGDPFVIAHAKAEGSVIVTEETLKGSGTHDHNLKIPNVAQEHDVSYLNFFGLLRAENWKF